MAQPKPIQNQQSMDEILSSIRRIIDSGDHKARAEPPVMPVFDPPPPEPVNDVGTPARPPLSRDDLDSFADAIDARSAAPAAPETPPDRQGTFEPDERNGKYQARFTEDDSRAFARVASALTASTGTPAKAESATLHAPVDDHPPPAAVNDQVPDVVLGPTPEAKVEPLPVSKTSEQPVRTLEPLISVRAQQSVGHSFEALSETLKEKAGRDLGEMAEKMLRPMLSDWLDNNLPAIVERLVRAEIERIARGEPRQG